MSVNPRAGTYDDEPLAILQRWQDAGGVWCVLARVRDQVTIGLYTCTGGEEVDRLTSRSPRLLRFLADQATTP